jgi:hypothetical protein
MKLIILFLLIFLSATFCNKLKSHEKHRETLDEALGSTFQINSNSLFDNFAAPAKTAAPATASSKDAGNSSGNSSAVSSKVIKEGWLILSAMKSLSARKYPMIPLGKDNWGRVETVRKVLNTTITGPTQQGQSNSFRKNQHYKIDASVPADNAFYFRVSGLNLYYTETSKDMIVLGAIAMDNIISPSTSKLGDNCFSVRNKQNDRWDLCTKDLNEKKAWVCAIMQAFGRPCEGQNQAGPLVINEKRIVKEPMILIPLPSPVCNEDWDYGSKGTNWNCKCSEGFEQSPINVERRCVSNINETASFQWSKVKTSKLAAYYLRRSSLVLPFYRVSPANVDRTSTRGLA